MKNRFLKSICIAILLIGFSAVAQEDDTVKSNIQTYTPSKLLSKGQWDIKLFNNLYTETRGSYNGVNSGKARETYFTSTVDIFTGISDNNRLNIGLLLEYRSNTVNGKSATAVFNFGEDVSSRNGLSSFAPAIKWQPISTIGNFSIQSAFHIPLIGDESNVTVVFLDQTTFAFQNRFFYDYIYPSGKWQLFMELYTEYNFREEASFANNTFVLAPGVYIIYFPSDKTTVLGFV